MNCVMATGLKYSNILFVRIEADGGNVVGEKLDVKSILSFLLFKEGGLFDSDHDGSLNAYERSMMDSVVYGEGSEEKSYMEDESDDFDS